MNGKIVATFPKGVREEVRVTLSEFKGTVYVDLRVWFEPHEGGERRPSNKGVTFKPEQVEQLITALQTIGRMEGDHDAKSGV